MSQIFPAVFRPSVCCGAGGYRHMASSLRVGKTRAGGCCAAFQGICAALRFWATKRRRVRPLALGRTGIQAAPARRRVPGQGGRSKPEKGFRPGLGLMTVRLPGGQHE